MKRIYTMLVTMALLMAVGIVRVNAQVMDVCAGNDTVELHLGNFHYGYVQWQVSEDNEFWSDIDGAVDTVYRFLPERPQFYRAEVRFPNCSDQNYYSQVTYVQTPPRAYAGPDFSIPAGMVARLCGSTLKETEGEWRIIEGEDGLIEDASDPTSAFIGVEGEYKLTWTLTNSCGSDTDTVTIHCVQLAYQPDIVYVDETDALLSDSTQLLNGEYVVVFSSPVPDIQEGTVLLGYRTPSFLRKVTSFERNGDLFVMQTEQGLLTDVIMSGALYFDPIGVAEGDGKQSVRYIDHYPTRREMTDNPFLLRDGNIYVIRDMSRAYNDKNDDFEITAEIENGALSLGVMLNLGMWQEQLDGLIYDEEVRLTPNLRTNISIDENGHLNECYLGLYNATFGHSVNLYIDRPLSTTTIADHGMLNSSPMILAGCLVGTIPVTLTLDFPVSFQISSAIDGFGLSYTSTISFTNAIEYDSQTHEFIKIHEKQKPEIIPGVFDMNGTLGLDFQAGVNFSILLAGVTGPYVEWRGTTNPSFCTSPTPPNNFNADMNLGLDMDLGWRVHLIKDLMESDVSKNFKLIDRKEQAPGSVKKYLGDNQVYSSGNYLPTPITVDVEGWFGTKLPNAKVFFEPEAGSEVSETEVSTDLEGKASTQWKPNSSKGREKLHVKTFDCHGELVGGTPVVFHAFSSASDPCLNSNLTVDVYHVQEDRIVPQVSGGTEPYMYSTDGMAFSIIQPNIQTVPGNNYTFYIQDANGCEAMATYNEPFYDCENSGLTLTVSASGNVITATGYFGQEPYEYSIDGINYQSTGLFTPLLDGEYTIYVRDALGCVDTKHVTVLREGNLYVWISEIDGHSGTAEVMTSTGSLADRGVCWSTHHAPTVEDFHVSFGQGTGSFAFTINGLDSGTTYYVRAYALDHSGTSYSEERCINPSVGLYLPEVVATGVTSITQTSAVGSGNVTFDGNAAVTERGICWGTTHNPDISGAHIACGSGIGAFTGMITNLTPNTQYYARAYAINSVGTAYGDEIAFTTGNGGGSEVPEGAINGLFSVAPDYQVYFSQGNLQYIGSAATPYWKFADHQWDYLGDNGQAGGSPNVDRDLFGWGTSGFDHGAVCYQPWSNDSFDNKFYAYGEWYYNLFNKSGQADWGYNAISNGGNTINQWHTLSSEEWNYLFNTRNTVSGIRYAKAQVNNIYGVVLLPDDWDTSVFGFNNTNISDAPFESNLISATQWDVLENVGAVFLPASGERIDLSVDNIGFGFYWSASESYVSHYYGYDNATIGLLFGPSYLGASESSHYRRFGFSVRLVSGGNTNSQSGELPQVGIINYELITGSSVSCLAMVVHDGGLDVTERGVCWSTNKNPSINDDHVNCGSGIGEYEASLNGLMPTSVYYVRAYAINDMGVSYSSMDSIFTPPYKPWVETTGVSCVTQTTAAIDFIVESEEQNPIIEQGVCWSTDNHPDITGNHITNYNGVPGWEGQYYTNISGLIPNTTYYVCAYAINSVGISYGEVLEFKTHPENITPPEGALNGLFTVNSGGTQVWMSKGNLQYNASANIWRFAENQWDCIGGNNNNISPTYNGWIDLFGWSTSGIDHGAVCYQPWSTSANPIDYYAYGQWTRNLGDETGGADWGYNAISNGGNQISLWHTPAHYGGWRYLCYERHTFSGILFAKAKVNGVNGMILLPDNWNASYYPLNNANASDGTFDSNEISESVWISVFESNGAVFLPAAGIRYESGVSSLGVFGYYWSSEIYDEDSSSLMEIDDYFVGVNQSLFRCFGCSVRLFQYYYPTNK